MDHYGRSMQKWYQLLNEGQKERHVQVCQDIFGQLETEPNLLKRVVTGNESWIFEYNPLTNGRALNGRAHCHQDPKRRGCSSAKPR